jgi:Flp pilus assembly protein TadG
VEFGLIAPILVALVTGIMDYGYLYATRFGASAAAEEGARAGSLTAGDSDPEGAAVAAAQEKWDAIGLASEPVFTVTREGDPQMIVVRVDISPVALVGLVPTGAFHVTAARRMEQP